MRFGFFRFQLLSGLDQWCGGFFRYRLGLGLLHGGRGFCLYSFYRCLCFNRGGCSHFGCWGLSHDGARRLRGSGGFSSQALGLTLTATHFTRIVRRAAAADDRSSSFDSHFGDDRCRCFSDDVNRCGFSSYRGSLCDSNRYRSNFGRGFGLYGGFNSSGRCFHCRGSFNHDFDGFSYFGAAVADRSAFHDFARLLAGRCSFCADQCGAGNGSSSHDHSAFSAFFSTVFAAFDQVAIGITLALAAVAATTLTAGATARTIAAFTTFLAIIELLTVFQYFFFGYGSGLFGAWLTFFTRLARLAFFAWLALGTFFAARLLATGFVSGCSVQWFTQFAWATFFARLTGFAWLTLTARLLAFAGFARLTGFTRLTFFTWLTRLANFTGLAWLALFAWLARLTGFARLALFTRLALFITAAAVATVTVTTVLRAATATLLIAAWLALGRLLFDCRGGSLFLAGEQADQ